MVIGTSDGETFNSKWDQYATKLGWKEPVENGPVIKNRDGGLGTTQQDKRTSDAPKGSGGPSMRDAPSRMPEKESGSEDPRGMIPHITSEAKRLGIDPDVAIGVAKSEGLRNPTGDHGMSHGAFQLYTGGGLGNEFQTKTGLDPSDPKNEKEGITFALEHAAQHGWSAFHGAKRIGISEWQGIPDHIDTSHHVPLAASAKIDREGNPVGVSIHSDAPKMDDDIFHRGVALHETVEANAMRDLIKGGMDPYEAYTMAHENFATPLESNFIKAERGEDFLENQYKPYWRQVAAMAKEQAESDEPTNLGPNDHTSIYGLNREVKMKNAQVAMDYSKFRKSTNIEDNREGQDAEQNRKDLTGLIEELNKRDKKIEKRKQKLEGK